MRPVCLKDEAHSVAAVFCEHCHPDDSEIPFDWLPTEVTGKHGPYEFILNEPGTVSELPS